MEENNTKKRDWISAADDWIREKDRFGHFAQFNYRGKQGYGTPIGGICSLFISVSVFLVVCTQLGALVYSHSWNQSSVVRYVDIKNGKSVEPYEIDAGLFVPTFAIITNSSGVNTFNNDTLFEWTFVQTNKEGPVPTENIPAISCYDYITGDKWADFTED